MAAELSDEYFRSMARVGGVGIIATDEQLLIRFCNEAAANILGRPAAELLGQPVLQIVPADRVEFTQRLLERLSESGGSADFEFRYPRPDGHLVHLVVTLSAVRDDPRHLGVSVFVRDLSRQMGLLRDMAQTQKMAALESMAGAVAHYFNNILGGALTTADFALASDDPDLHKRTLGITVSALARANELTRGLLAFAEGEHTEPLTVDLRQAIDAYLARLELTLQVRSVQLEQNIQSVSVSLPAKGLTTVIDRLIANALDAMPHGGTLTVQLQPAGDHGALLRIGDTGPGISEHNLPRIFEPFFTTKQPGRGRPSEHPGLGLAVVYGIVKSLRGTIAATAAPEGSTGTVFTVRLPGDQPTNSNILPCI